MTAAPVLRTGRLQLPRLTTGDAPLLLRVWNDAAFIRYVGDRGVRTVAAAEVALEEGAFRLYRDYGFGPYRVELSDTATPIGICGLFRRETLEDPDLGYAVLPEFCKRGYASEAATAVLQHAGGDLGMSRVIAIISPENAASIGLIGKLGFRFERSVCLSGAEPSNLYGIDLAAAGYRSGG